MAKRLKRKLTPKQHKYIRGITKRKSKRQAALDAGYSEHVANNAGALIENSANVRQSFQNLIRKHVSESNIAQRIAEGLDAEETKFFQKDGKVVSSRNLVNWTERREYAKLAAEYGGYFVPKQQIESSGPNGGPIQVQASIAGMTDEQLREAIEAKKAALAPKAVGWVP